uniref:HNH endonuclease n=1 Tax=Marinobacterium profundum TaxID=1714300 RepID=UPI000829F665|nr:HNH endonuclease [Marinobacterium profundum]
MTTKPLDRLMFVQGGLCFFCKQPMPKSEASVEHLLASSNGGSNNDENCVVCCKAVNALFGSMSLKEKFQVVLNQKGQFKCPNGAGSIKPAAKPKAKPKVPATVKTDKFKLVVANLKQRGNSKPRTLKTLTSTIASLFPKGISQAELAELIKQLEITGKVVVTEKKLTYAL